MANLIPTKFLDFKGLERNSNQPDRNSNLLRVTNMDTHQKPGTMTLREGYELRYPKPTDIVYNRIENGDFISFENFYEKTAAQGTEITVEVQTGEVVSPTMDTGKITDYKFRAANIWIRPYWNGSYWLDNWQWLNESWITKITVDVDATYKNKIQFEGYFGNLSQWTLINATKDTRIPIAVLKTKQNGTNTDCWLGTWDPAYDVNDVVILMRNYIPLDIQKYNYDVNRKEISFHRIFSKMRIGFGGKEKRYGYGIEFIRSTIQLADYNFPSVDPELVGTEYIFAAGLKTMLSVYTAFDFNEDYDFIIASAAGDLPIQTHYFRMTVVLDGTDEVMVKEKEIITTELSKLLALPVIRLGSFNRRITEAKIYYSANGDDYYLFGNYSISNKGSLEIDQKNLELMQNGYLACQLTSGATELHTEPNAASASDTNSVGSWTAFVSSTGLSSVVATNYALEMEALVTTIEMKIKYPLDKFAYDLKPGKKYTIAIRCKASDPTEGALGLQILYNDPGAGGILSIGLTSTFITNAYVDYTFEITLPTAHAADWLYFALTLGGGGMVAAGTKVDIESFSIIEKDTAYLDTSTVLGESMLVELGYQPTFNLVKDWMDALVTQGRTWLAGSYIEERYDNLIFGSQISGLSANMHDVIPAQTFLDVEKYSGEVVVGIALLSNGTMVALKDGSLVIVEPETGQIYEVNVGFGCINKNSVLVVRDSLYYNSQFDIMKMSAATGYIAQSISDRFVRDIYQAITDKSTAHCCMEKYGSYLLALVDDKEGVEFPELLLTSRGWLDQNRFHHPQVYRNGLAGRIWFMHDGDIYALPFDEDAFIGYADVYGNYDSGW